MLPAHGSVLGIDVGYSTTKKSTGFCHLWWSPAAINWSFSECTSDDGLRREALHSVLPDGWPVLAVAIDGPLRPKLEFDSTRFRTADCILSRGSFQKRGKPGQTHTPVGKRLHEHATKVAELVVQECNLATATSPFAIHRLSVYEAFPNLFLGVLLDEPGYPLRPTNSRCWTDCLYPAVAEKLTAILKHLLPDHACAPLNAVANHEQIASLTCAITAVCIAANECIAVGCSSDGFITLPPLPMWGTDAEGDFWAERELRGIVRSLEYDTRRQFSVQIYNGDALWLSTNSTERHLAEIR
jgi:hypothetical protein